VDHEEMQELDLSDIVNQTMTIFSALFEDPQKMKVRINKKKLQQTFIHTTSLPNYNAKISFRIFDSYLLLTNVHYLNLFFNFGSHKIWSDYTSLPEEEQYGYIHPNTANHESTATGCVTEDNRQDSDDSKSRDSDIGIVTP
jgi:hypothetical protein